MQATRTIGDKWLVDGGLVAGDRVIVEGLQKVQPGMPVAGDRSDAAASGTGAPATVRAASDSPAAAAQK